MSDGQDGAPPISPNSTRTASVAVNIKPRFSYWGSESRRHIPTVTPAILELPGHLDRMIKRMIDLIPCQVRLGVAVGLCPLEVFDDDLDHKL